MRLRRRANQGHGAILLQQPQVIIQCMGDSHRIDNQIKPVSVLRHLAGIR